MTWNRFLMSAVMVLMTGWAFGQSETIKPKPKPPAATDAGLLSRWQFKQETVKDGTVPAEVGPFSAKVMGPAAFGKESPFALRLDGNSKAKHRVVISDRPEPSQLPTRNLTVEAWVKIEKPIEWGGLVGLIQDNGSYERGWLLGFRHSQFSFAMAGKQPGKLSYLTARKRYSPGYWYHVVGTYDGNEQCIYMDGELVGKETTQRGDINYPPGGEYVIGAYKDDDELYTTEGEIEQVSVWNRTLSAKEIAERFRQRSREFPEIVPVRPVVTDWPTYNRDNQRTGVSPDEMPLPLSLAWEYQLRHPPHPAWPPPAKQDFWHHKYNLSPRVVYDRANHVASVGDRVFFGSSSDDAVRCLHAKTGELLWTFFAEAPVRLAPTVEGDRLLFGSDDGFVYCLDIADGRLHWKTRLDDEDRRFPGNRRIIGSLPVRSGVLVEKNVVYFCAGLFPKQGVYQAGLDLKTGKILAKGQIDKSAQGYLERRSGQLFVPTGRDPAGAFVAKLSRRGKDIGQEVRSIPNAFPYAFIGAGNLRFGGGDGEVAAFDVNTGKKVWEAKVEGKAWSLAVSQGRLLVSTDAGRIYAFAPGKQSPPVHTPPPIITKPDPQAAETVAKFVKATGLHLGFALIASDEPLPRVLELARQTELQIVLLTTTDAAANAHRQAISQAGLSPRIAVHVRQKTDPLPYTDYLFNLIIADRTAGSKRVAELHRVQRPHGGILAWGWNAGDAEIREPLAEVGEWSHMYANPENTVCSNDQHVGSEMKLQWFGPPGPRQMLDRHLRTVAPLWKNGRMFIPGDNRVIAVDAYNGTPLWNVEVPNSRRVGAYRDCSYLVAGEDSVFVAAENVLLRLDAQTGKQLAKWPVPNPLGPNKQSPHGPAVADRPVEWGYLATKDHVVVGTAAAPNASRRESSLVSIREGTFWDARPLVTSEGVYGLDDQTGETKWAYPGKGAIINSSMMITDGKVIFVESHNPETLANRPGRVKPSDLFHYGVSIVALDLQTGKEVWRTPQNMNSIEHNIFGCAAEGKVVIVGSRNNGSDREKSRVFYDVHVFDGKTGKPVWNRSQNQNTKIDGDHGEQDHHPVIVGDRLYCEPFAYQLHNGEPLADWNWNPKHRRGCGTISASARTFFFRESNPTLFDLTTNTYDKVTTSTRPGCWINMIPAGGLLLIPEASSGCTCNYAIQTSLAFLPITKPKPSGPKPD